MGKGDRKTAKGKRYNSSYGNARTRAARTATGSPTGAVKKAPARAAKAPARKVVAKKAAARD